MVLFISKNLDIVIQFFVIIMLDVLYDLITGDHVYYLDELGEDLHYDLLFYYLNVFLFNSEKSQLIITSQETALLQQDLINDNRGVVWFVEKNRETASSEYNRGDSYGLHKNLSLYNSYRIGRLGAKPELGSIFVKMEEITGKKFGDKENPLLVSVRSGARASMPGMMDTILNLGLNETVVNTIAEQSGNPRWAWDCYSILS